MKLFLQTTAVLALVSVQMVAAADFLGSGTGPIPDRTTAGCGGGVFGPPLDVTFDVFLGMSGPITDVAVSIDLEHTWVSDLDVVLVAPTGESHVLFSRVRATTDTGCGDGSVLNGIYTFNDQAAGTNFWTEAFNNTVLTPGEYRTTEAGGAGQVDPAPVTDMTSAFSGIASPNGTWTLRFRDAAKINVGSVSAATLSIVGGAPFCSHWDLVIPPGSVSGDVVGCNSITNDGEVQVVGPGTRFRAGSVTLADGFSVASGAPLTVEIVAPTDPGGVIPAGDPNGLELAFDVTGLTQVVSRVWVRLQMAHTFVGDLTATLTSPGGVARLVLFGRPGNRPSFAGGNSGVSSNLDGTYIFDDFALGDFWATIAGLGTSDAIPSGYYRTSTAAPFGPAENLLSNAGGCSTYLSGAFSGLTAAQANGTWTLKLVDGVYAADTGSVGAAKLFVEEIPTVNPNPIQGSSVRGDCTPAKYDFTGTGRTSFAVVRPVLGTSAIQWLITGNDGTDTGQPEQVFTFGNLLTDYVVPNDYDGDGIWDAAIWRPGAIGRFSARRSSRPRDVPIEFDLGQTGDDPAISGDYDGDGVADPAVHRLPEFPAAGLGQFLAISSSSGGLVTDGFSTVVGTVNTVFAEGGFDHTGDGIADLALQHPSSSFPGCGGWTVMNGATGAVVEEFGFGLETDRIVPGNRRGNSQADTTIVRPGDGQFFWYVKDCDGCDPVSLAPTCGISATSPDLFIQVDLGEASDWPLVGDFDGNGLDDFAVWKPVAAPPDPVNPCGDGDPPSVNCQGFIVGEPPLSGPYPDADIVLEFRYGVTGDFPLAFFHVK